EDEDETDEEVDERTGCVKRTDELDYDDGWLCGDDEVYAEEPLPGADRARVPGAGGDGLDGSSDREDEGGAGSDADDEDDSDDMLSDDGGEASAGAAGVGSKRS